MNRHRVILSTLIILMVLTIPGAAISQQSYSEDFTTTTYKDALNTTADWNTTAGVLRLPPLPSLVGSYDTPDRAYDVAVAGDLACVADGTTMRVIDISDPANPVLAGSFWTSGNARVVVVSGDHAFVAVGDQGLQVIDISNPASPVLAGSYNTSGFAYGVAVAGDHAFVADSNHGLKVIDISDPTNPLLAGSYNTPGQAFNVAIAGDHAFVADHTFGLQVIDISDPANPVLAGTCDTPGAAHDVAVAGDHTYVADYPSGLQVIDISDPSSPVLVGSYDTSAYTNGVAVSGDLAYMADGWNGLQVIDISDPTSPVLAGTFDTPDNAQGVAVSGDLAFVADFESGLQVVRVSRLWDPVLAGSISWPNDHAQGVTVSGDHAFVADDDNGLLVMDISDPASPVLAGSYYMGWAVDLVVEGDHAFVADGYTGMQVMDISDPTNPVYTGKYDPAGYVYDVAVAGDLACVVIEFTGFHVIDISDLGNPVLTGSYNTIGYAYGVVIAGDHAYVADGTAGLQVIDISNPAGPFLAGTYNTPGTAWDIAVAGNHAFVADQAGGLQVIDISDPSNPFLAGSYNTSGSAYDVMVAGNQAFVADWTGGLLVLDISNPASPAYAGSYDTSGFAYGVAVAGDHAYVADLSQGLQVIQVSQHEIDATTGYGIGQSLAVDGAADTIQRVRLMSTETGDVAWNLSADGGANWMAFTPDGSWTTIAVPGDDLLWQTAHTWSPGVNPTVSDLTIDWLNEFGPITAITDVPDDQGGWLRLNFSRSAYDFTDETSLPVEGYNIYRRVDDMQKRVRILSAPSHPTIKEAALSSFATHRVRQVDDRFYVLGGKAGGQKDRGEFPPGVWEFISFHPALQQDNYLSLVPTVADSTVENGIHWSVFLTTTQTTTPGIWFASHPDSGYSVDNIAPGVPGGFVVARGPSEISNLSWEESPEEDFLYFRVYRGDSEDFEIGPATLAHETAETNWVDSEGGLGHFYKLTALDHAGNESDPASADDMTDVDEGLPAVFTLHQNQPNPFNPATTIRFELPSAGDVRLEIYDVAGRRVATLLDGSFEAGQHAATWRGQSDAGHSVSSGLYFYRLSGTGFSKTRKMLLLQ